MNKVFVPYEQALELKKLGFDEPCFGYYYTLNGKDWKFAEKSEYYRLDDEINIGGKFSLLSPLYQQAFRFFNEKYGLNHYNIRRDYYISEDGVRSYDDIELECLKKLIEIAKEKKL